MWNYKPRAASLAADITRALGFKSSLVEGEKGMFDVIVNGRTIFSKHKKDRFPESAEIIDILRNKYCAKDRLWTRLKKWFYF